MKLKQPKLEAKSNCTKNKTCNEGGEEEEDTDKTDSSENKDECDMTKDKGELNLLLKKVTRVKEGEESIDKTFLWQRF